MPVNDKSSNAKITLVKDYLQINRN